MTQHNFGAIVHHDMKIGNGNLKVEEYDREYYYTLSDVTGTIVYGEREIRDIVDVLNKLFKEA